jgi:two-component system, cell cycle response regulator DivK
MSELRPPLTILVVEDNEVNRELIVRRLARLGFQLRVAADGEEALRSVLELPPGLILMDLSLPLVDGWEATRRLKADPRFRDIPVIAVTAHAMSGDRERALEAGCDEYATKPVEFVALVEKIRRLTGG